jgi:hypothetical protein
MVTILVRKTEMGFEYNMVPYSTASKNSWNRFPREVRTRADMKKYFAEGKHSWHPRQNIYDTEISFVDHRGQRVKHYTIERDGNLMFGVVDFDRTKKIVVPVAKIWPEPEQLNYLRDNANYLPKDILTLKEATEYLEQNEPGTFEVFQTELNRITTEGMKGHCQTHAQVYFSAEGIIDG